MSEETYTRIFTEVDGKTRNDSFIVLNRRFTKEEIATAMKDSNEYDEYRINEVVTRGVYLEENDSVIVKAKEDKCHIREGFTPRYPLLMEKYIAKGDEVQICSNATFKVIYHVNVIDFIRDLIEGHRERQKARKRYKAIKLSQPKI